MHEATKEELWGERVRAFRASGLTAREFSRRGGFHETTLSKWVRVFATKVLPPTTITLARLRPPPTATEPTSAPVAAGEADGAIEIELARGLVVRVRRGFDEQALRAVVRVLAERG